MSIPNLCIYISTFEEEVQKHTKKSKSRGVHEGGPSHIVIFTPGSSSNTSNLKHVIRVSYSMKLQGQIKIQWNPSSEGTDETIVSTVLSYKVATANPTYL